MTTTLRIDGLPVHKSVTSEGIVEAVERRMTSLDNPGICIGCGAEVEGVEPDAERYECESCEAPLVFGAEQLLFMTLA